MAIFKPYKLTNAKLSSLAIKEGQLIFVTDTKKIYVDTNASTRMELTANPSENELTNQNLNDVKITGYYYAAGGNGVTNKPGNVDAFALFTYRNAQGYYIQELTDANKNPMKKYLRQFNSTSWTSWTEMKYTDTTYSNATTNTAGLMSAEDKMKLDSGVAELNDDGKILTSQLPSYVDDVLEYNAKSVFPATGESGKIYIDLSDNKTYRWSGSTYVEISASLALGETSSTAYRGDRGKIAYDHSQIKDGNPHGTDLTDLGVTATAVELNYVDGVTSAIQTQLDNKVDTSIIPNNSGEIKTKYRVAKKGYASNSAIWYYPLVKLPTDDSGNYASLIISGRLGGWVATNMSSINALLWNRDSIGIAVFDIAGSANTMSSIWNLCDLVIYKNEDKTATVYIKCKGYFLFDFNLELFQSAATILYDGNYQTVEPTGTLSAQASTSTKRVEIVSGEMYIDGIKVLTADNYSDILTNYLPLSGGTMTGDLKFSGSQKLVWDAGTYRQRIEIVDDANANTDVFHFQQSTDNGNSYTNLMTIKDNGAIVATGKITAGVAPTENMDVATKKYVDDSVASAGAGAGGLSASALQPVEVVTE